MHIFANILMGFGTVVIPFDGITSQQVSVLLADIPTERRWEHVAHNFGSGSSC
jgi:hypothetical protein